MSELADQGVYLLERELEGGLALKEAADEAVGGDLELEGGGAGLVHDDRPVLLREAEDAEDAAHADLAVVAVDGTADGTDVIAIRNKGLLSLSFDHRLIDGAIADIFMADMKKTLENWHMEP